MLSTRFKGLKFIRNRREYTFLILLLSIFAILICAFLPGWISNNTPTSELPFSLHSVKEANYSIDRNKATIPAISLNIIKDVMRDNNVSEAEIAVRIGTLSSSLLTPVPMSTGTLSIPNTPVPVTPIVTLPTFSTTGSPEPTPKLATPNPTQILASPSQPTAIPPTPRIIYLPVPTEKPDDEPKPAIALKSSVSGYADNDTSGTITFNDDLQYQFIVKNTGDTVLSNISVKDNSFGGTITCPTASLAAGANMICTADALHSITLPEANTGSVIMNSTVLAAYVGKSYSNSSTLSTAISQNPAISLEKILKSYDDNDASSSITEGDALWYKFKIRNTGNVSLNSPDVSDDSFGLTVTCPPATLVPGTYVYCTATTFHTVSVAETSAGYVTNTATGSAQFNGNLYFASDTLTTPVSLPAPKPSITLSKSLGSYNDNDASSNISLGDGLIYAFTVTNTGNVVLSDIEVTDISFNLPVSCPASSLTPAASMLCSTISPYVVTIPEAIAGQISNTASGSGKYLNTPYTATDTLTTAVIQGTGLISGYVLEDTDNDGDLNDSDSGIASVTINLAKQNEPSNIYATTTTDANGFFSFANLPGAVYSVFEIDPSNYTSTADSYGPNNNRANFTLSDGQQVTDIVFLDHNPATGCSAPDPVNGFVASTNPANGAVNVPMSTTTITITFNQPMMDTGGQSVDRIDKYAFKNNTTNKKVDIASVTYDSATYTATITIDITDSDWQAGSLYELTIKTVQNACGTAQSSITRTFTTQ